MGVRLYPRTTNDVVLEKLAGVPKGTANKLRSAKAVKVFTRKGVDYYLVPGARQLRPVRDFGDFDLILDGNYERTSADQMLARLECFLLSGWGQFTWEAAKQLVEWGHADENGDVDCCGHIDDPERVAKLLEQMTLDVITDHLLIQKPEGRVFCDVTISQLEGVVWGREVQTGSTGLQRSLYFTQLWHLPSHLSMAVTERSRNAYLPVPPACRCRSRTDLDLPSRAHRLVVALAPP